jgi:AraC family transcriptional regulator
MNNLNPCIEVLNKTLLAEHFMQMSLFANKTFDLCNDFQKKRQEITHVLGSALYSMPIYSPNMDFQQFNPSTEFTKWAAVELSTHKYLPTGLKPYVLEGLLHEVFNTRGHQTNLSHLCCT